MKYTKKPVTIDAFRLGYANLADLRKWVQSFGDDFDKWFNTTDQGPDGASLSVNTLEGTYYHAHPGEWIIRGIQGEYYPCKPNIFEKTYSQVDESPTQPQEDEGKEQQRHKEDIKRWMSGWAGGNAYEVLDYIFKHYNIYKTEKNG